MAYRGRSILQGPQHTTGTAAYYRGRSILRGPQHTTGAAAYYRGRSILYEPQHTTGAAAYYRGRNMQQEPQKLTYCYLRLHAQLAGSTTVYFLSLFLVAQRDERNVIGFLIRMPISEICPPLSRRISDCLSHH
jgi:hypothetical protein